MAPCPASAHAYASLGAAVEATLATAGVSYAALGLVVADARTGEIRVAMHPDAPMVPASVMKLATSAVALRALGPDFRFVTRLSARAPIAEGMLTGDLVLVGGADPSLTRADLAELARALRARGVARVAGDLVVDATRVTEPGWAPGWSVDDLDEPYAAPVSGLNLDANLRPEPATSSSRLVPDPDPAASAGAAMAAALAAAGIVLQGQVRSGNLPPDAALLAEHASAPLGELLMAMNKESRNLYAESLFRSLDPEGRAAASARAMEQGVAALGVATEDVRIADGSGLSRYDLLTPRAIARILCSMEESEALRRSLPVAGVDGTLARRFQASPVQGRLVAKTGTMSGVSALAGYMEGSRGRRWVVTITVNGFTGSVRPVQALEDALVERVFTTLEGEM